MSLLSDAFAAAARELDPERSAQPWTCVIHGSNCPNARKPSTVALFAAVEHAAQHMDPQTPRLDLAGWIQEATTDCRPVTAQDRAQAVDTEAARRATEAAALAAHEWLTEHESTTCEGAHQQ